jgi:hypothetical protein
MATLGENEIRILVHNNHDRSGSSNLNASRGAKPRKCHHLAKTNEETFTIFYKDKKKVGNEETSVVEPDPGEQEMTHKIKKSEEYPCFFKCCMFSFED